jgi:hypothetical protein
MTRSYGDARVWINSGVPPNISGKLGLFFPFTLCSHLLRELLRELSAVLSPIDDLGQN